MRKKLFAVIMSVMMMVTFMPAMAFANHAEDAAGLASKKSKMVSDSNFYYATNVEMAEDYQSATADVYLHNTGTPATSPSDTTNDQLVQKGAKGVIEEVNFSKTEFINTGLERDHLGQTRVVFCFADSYFNKWDNGTTMSDDPLYVECYYYDLSNAKLGNVVNGKFTAVDQYETVTYGGMVDALGNNDEWTFKRANDTAQTVESTFLGNTVQFTSGTKKAVVSLKTVLNAGAELTIYPTEGYEDFADGSYTFNYDFDCANMIRSNGFNSDNSSWNETAFVANNGSQSQTVALKKVNVFAKLANMKFNSGKKLNIKVVNNSLTGLEYTGEDQKLTLVTKGYVAQYYYKAEGETARAWHDEAPAMVNADTYRLQVRFAPEGTTNWTSPETLTVTVNALPAWFGFSKDSYSVRGTKLTAKTKYTLIKATPVTNWWGQVTGYEKVREVVLADADKTVFDSIVDKYVTFTEDHDDQLTDYTATAKLDVEALAADKDAAVKQFLKNYNIVGGAKDTTMVFTNGVISDNVTAVNQTKTFHVKNAKALKGAKKFQLKGDKAEYGTITYIKKSGAAKVKVASNGKVTVKKGLKKGTYKVKIKVKAAGDSEIKTLTVKIKK